MPTTQSKLNITGDETEVEKYRFEPIKGYPMLHWRGKRPFESTQYYPAQIKESHGEPASEGWMNQIFWGDNLQVMSHLLKKYRGQVKLIYIDPPFDSKADYKKRITVRGQSVANDQTTFEEKQYTDIWTNDEYLQFMYERLILLRELLSEDGSIYVHCDSHKSHYLRAILDEIFGNSNFLSEVIWQRSTTVGSSKAIAKRFPTLTDTILVYVKHSENYFFNKLYTPPSEEYKARFKEKDDYGYFYWNTLASYSEETFENLKKQGRVRWSDGAKFPQYKTYLHELKGNVVSNIWSDINMLNPMAEERQSTNYPTQKPEALLERILLSSTSTSDLVFDCFMGSGTTQAAAIKLGRRFLGADINLGAVQTTTKRLLGIADTLRGQLDHEKFYTGFEVYNVNHYDVFRNPIQARDLLIEALEIQPLPGNQVWDGEKDGRFVKIMPVNRIATRADLNELIANLDYRTYEKRNHEAPNKAVEHITLVCMGHEPDLAAVLKEQVPFRLDVEVVDILRDKSNLEFRRDAEADIRIEGGHLIIKAFYPMNLLQKLSLMKENVQDWRELTESVMIDFNFDGGVFAPQITDIPDKNELVRGTYTVPAQAGTIRVKITDLLSESLEISIKN
ncbi:MAG: site-specific DNA-methyltransferase [Saprospiraceae bacterium]|nr:site-specific DNA-methyltransferase [Saprospiraceae bacterium]